MKPRERFGPDDPREWLDRARSNLARARHRVPGTQLEDACFDAQQAAEKAIKAVILNSAVESRSQPFRATVGWHGPTISDGRC